MAGKKRQLPIKEEQKKAGKDKPGKTNKKSTGGKGNKNKNVKPVVYVD